MHKSESSPEKMSIDIEMSSRTQCSKEDDVQRETNTRRERDKDRDRNIDTKGTKYLEQTTLPQNTPHHKSCFSEHGTGSPSRFTCLNRIKEWAVRVYKHEQWNDGTLIALKTDVFAGITLAIAQVAPSVAFALMAHGPPLMGLFSSFFLGMICCLFGGRPGQITAVAGAVVVLYPNLVDKHGYGAVCAVSIISGCFILLPGIFRIARLVRLLPASLMLGFCNGLGLAMVIHQVPAFRDENGEYVTGRRAFNTAVICIVTYAVMMILPYFMTFIPSTFIAIVIGTAIEYIFRLHTVTIGDLYKLHGDFPQPQLPPIQWHDSQTIKDVMIASVLTAIISCIKSFMSDYKIQQLTETKTNFEREALALGAAHIINGFFQGIPGCVVFGPCILNIESNAGTRRLSSFICALLMGIIPVALYMVIGIIPMAALSAVLFGVSSKTADWRMLAMILLQRISLQESIVAILVTVMTVVEDLAIGAACGFAAALLFFMWNMARGRVSMKPLLLKRGEHKFTIVNNYSVTNTNNNKCSNNGVNMKNSNSYNSRNGTENNKRTRFTSHTRLLSSCSSCSLSSLSTNSTKVENNKEKQVYRNGEQEKASDKVSIGSADQQINRLHHILCNKQVDNKESERQEEQQHTSLSDKHSDMQQQQQQQQQYILFNQNKLAKHTNNKKEIEERLQNTSNGQCNSEKAIERSNSKKTWFAKEREQEEEEEEYDANRATSNGYDDDAHKDNDALLRWKTKTELLESSSTDYYYDKNNNNSNRVFIYDLNDSNSTNIEQTHVWEEQQENVNNCNDDDIEEHLVREHGERTSGPNFSQMIMEETEMTMQNRSIIGTNYAIDFNLLNIEEDDIFPEIKVLRIKLRGVLFFGSCMEFVDGFLVLLHTYHSEIFLKVTDFILDFQDGLMPIMDFSASEAIQDVGRILAKRGIRTHVRNMDPLSHACFERCRRYFPDIEEDNVNNVKDMCFLRRIFKIESTHIYASANQIAQNTQSPLNDDVFLRANRSFVVAPPPLQGNDIERHEHEVQINEEEKLDDSNNNNNNSFKKCKNGKTSHVHTSNSTISCNTNANAIMVDVPVTHSFTSTSNKPEMVHVLSETLLSLPSNWTTFTSPSNTINNDNNQSNTVFHSEEVQVPLSNSIKVGFPIFRPKFGITVPVFATIGVWKTRMQHASAQQSTFEWNMGLTSSTPFNRQFGDIGKLWWRRLWNRDINYMTNEMEEQEQEQQEELEETKRNTDNDMDQEVLSSNTIASNEPLQILTRATQSPNEVEETFQIATTPTEVQRKGSPSLCAETIHSQPNNNVNNTDSNRNASNGAIRTIANNKNGKYKNSGILVERKAPTRIIQVPRFPGQGFAKSEKLNRAEYIAMQRLIYHELFNTEPPSPHSPFVARMSKFRHDLADGFV